MFFSIFTIFTKIEIFHYRTFVSNPNNRVHFTTITDNISMDWFFRFFIFNSIRLMRFVGMFIFLNNLNYFRSHVLNFFSYLVSHLLLIMHHLLFVHGFEFSFLILIQRMSKMIHMRRSLWIKSIRHCLLRRMFFLIIWWAIIRWGILLFHLLLIIFHLLFIHFFHFRFLILIKRMCHMMMHMRRRLWIKSILHWILRRLFFLRIWTARWLFLFKIRSWTIHMRRWRWIESKWSLMVSFLLFGFFFKFSIFMILTKIRMSTMHLWRSIKSMWHWILRPIVLTKLRLIHVHMFSFIRNYYDTYFFIRMVFFNS